MAILDVITIGHETLRKRTSEVTKFDDPKLQKLIDDMIPTMYEKDGIGLAANQVNVSLRIAVLVPDPHHFEEYRKKRDEALVIINPILTEHSASRELGEEGCLSVPGYCGDVKRWKSVTVTFQDRHGDNKTIKATGLFAKVFQHEIDHLDGILFVDRAEGIYELTKEELRKIRAKRKQQAI